MPPKMLNRNGRARVTLTDAVTGKRREYALGEYGTAQAEAKYHALMQKFSAMGKRLPFDAREGMSVVELVEGYWAHAKGRYQPNHLATIKSAITLLVRHYGDEPADEFGPLRLQELREIMVNHGLDGRRWSRGYVNAQINRIRSVFTWGVSMEIVRPETLTALKSVGPLKEGQTTAHETTPVESVDLQLVEGSIPEMPRQIRTMVELQLVTGARPGEIVRLKMRWVSKHSEELWIFTIPKGEAKVRSKPRPIPLGPRAIRAIEPFITTNPDAFLFSPADSLMESMGYVRGGERAPGERYTTGSYRQAIQAACDKGFPVPEDCEDQKAWKKAHRWNPNQLRHWALSEIEYASDDRAASVVAGHSNHKITNEVYIHRAAKHFERIIERCSFMRES